jgi:hypothetical protein
MDVSRWAGVDAGAAPRRRLGRHGPAHHGTWRGQCQSRPGVKRKARDDAGDAVDVGGVEGFGQCHRRPDGGQPPRPPWRPHPSRAEEQDVGGRTPASRSPWHVPLDMVIDTTPPGAAPCRTLFMSTRRAGPQHAISAHALWLLWDLWLLRLDIAALAAGAQHHARIEVFDGSLQLALDVGDVHGHFVQSRVAAVTEP